MHFPSFTVKPGLVALMTLMAATRFHHFGNLAALPDASLAIFFLAGLWLGGRFIFTLLLLEAGLIDYWAISQLGVSDFCISPAYLFLIPTYATMWLGGAWCRKQVDLSFSGAVSQLVVLVASTSAAFLLSNGSFFLLSDKNTDISWVNYVDGFARYYPQYLNSTLIYAVGIFAVVTIAKSLLASKTSQQTV